MLFERASEAESVGREVNFLFCALLAQAEGGGTGTTASVTLSGKAHLGGDMSGNDGTQRSVVRALFESSALKALLNRQLLTNTGAAQPNFWADRLVLAAITAAARAGTAAKTFAWLMGLLEIETHLCRDVPTGDLAENRFGHEEFSL